MKKEKSIVSKIILLLVFGVITVSVCVIFFYPKVLANKNHKVTGWAWSKNIGWLSLNCYNEGLLNQCVSADYGLDYDKNSGELSGWSWSEYGGWVCFGSACLSVPLNLSPDALKPWAKIDSEGLLSGWANWVSLGGNGWVRLQGMEKSLAGKKFACRNCASLKGTVGDSCGICFVNPFNEGSSEICKNCLNCTNGICESCKTCFSYGTAIDFSNNTMLGWAWNNDKNDVGFGWLKFHPTQTKTLAFAPYLETVGGDIYAQKGIGSLYQGTAPDKKYNATYLVQSNGDIVHFSSQCETDVNCVGTGWMTEEAGEFGVPKKENNYYNKMGGLDLKGILAGQYGGIEFIKNDWDIDNMLGGKVYYYNGDLNLVNRDFLNGMSDISGAGTLIVKGNLRINGNLAYQNSAVTKLKNLASLGVVVLKKEDGTGGNIYIDPLVTSVVGSYLAENMIYTGTINGGIDSALQIDGLLIATGFKFERNVFNLETKAAAERVIYDGRVLTNTPPGFTDMGKALPRF
jgi:phosphoribosyl-AMP cyclohydrolase